MLNGQLATVQESESFSTDSELQELLCTPGQHAPAEGVGRIL